MPSRVIRGEINSSVSLNRVSIGAELTFDRLITAVDDFGRFDARREMLKAALFPVRADAPPELVMEWIRELVNEGCVRIYEVDGRSFLYLPAWERHRGNQRRANKSRFPAPPGCTEPPSTEGVYFIRSGDSGPIKIGHSAGLKARFEALRTAVPNLEVLAVVLDEGRAAERRLHRRFAHIKVDREWFKPEPELLEWIAHNGQPWAVDGHVRALPVLPGVGVGVGVGLGDGVGVESDPAATPPPDPDPEVIESSKTAVTPVEPPSGRSPQKPKRATQCPEELTAEQWVEIRTWRDKKHPKFTDAHLEREWDRHADWHISKGNTRKVWVRSFRTWLTNDIGKSQSGKSDPVRPQPPLVVSETPPPPLTEDQQAEVTAIGAERRKKRPARHAKAPVADLAEEVDDAPL